MANLIRNFEGCARFTSFSFKNMSDNEERFYTSCLISVEGLSAKQDIHLIVKSIDGKNEEILYKKDIELGKEIEVIGPIIINKKCKLIIDGDLKPNCLENAKCKIETNVSFDDTYIPTLRVGVFFDGTGNNAYNSISNKNKNLLLKSNNMIIPRSYFIDKSSSSHNPCSNIWHLHSSFQEGKIHDNLYQIKTYVEGIGTKKGKNDCPFTMATGCSFFVGTEKTGVIDKTNDAIMQTKEIIKTVNINFEIIEFCIFGFSRGATAARHFTNRIKKQYREIFEIFKSKENLKIRIKFMGLFDSVAAILSLWPLNLDPGNSNTGSVNINLEKNITEDIFHITAGHELRRNFSLNHITKNYQSELELPGVHADIGGGYHDNLEELLNISEIFYNEVVDEVDNKNTSSYKVAKEKLETLLKHPKWGDIYKIINLEVAHTITDEGLGPYGSFANFLRIKRGCVCTGLDRISFQAMRYYASKCGLIFNALKKNIVENIPSDLENLHKQSCVQVNHIYSRRESASLANSISPELGSKYIHHSFFYDTSPTPYVLESQSILDFITMGILFTNAPNENHIRREFNADGTEYN